MTKENVYQELIAQLSAQIRILKSALSESEENASGDESKSEGKYDTRAIEASYLAQAQAEQLALEEESLARLQRFTPPGYTINDSIDLGALVEVQQDNELCFYFLAPAGGGLVTDFLGCQVTVVTPESQMYQQLIHLRLGDTILEKKVTIMGLE